MLQQGLRYCVAITIAIFLSTVSMRTVADHHKSHGRSDFGVTNNMPPGLQEKGLPPGLEKQGKMPHGWSKGKKTGWDKDHHHRHHHHHHIKTKHHKHR